MGGVNFFWIPEPNSQFKSPVPNKYFILFDFPYERLIFPQTIRKKHFSKNISISHVMQLPYHPPLPPQTHTKKSHTTSTCYQSRLSFSLSSPTLLDPPPTTYTQKNLAWAATISDHYANFVRNKKNMRVQIIEYIIIKQKHLLAY